MIDTRIVAIEEPPSDSWRIVNGGQWRATFYRCFLTDEVSVSYIWGRSGFFVSLGHMTHPNIDFMWRGGVVVSASDLLRLMSRLWAICSHTVCFCSPSSINWYWPLAGKVTVGLALHWPCVTDSVVYPPTGSMAWEREMSTPPKLHLEYYSIFTFTLHIDFAWRAHHGRNTNSESKVVW